MGKNKYMPVRIDEELYERIKRIAKGRYTWGDSENKSEVVRQALEIGLDKLEELQEKRPGEQPGH